MTGFKFKSIVSILAKRGFPLTVEAIKASSSSYSQFGEDSILASLFEREGSNKYYLDLGCYHPLIWSNTYHFYRRGWRGLTVDASPAFQHAWRRHRPRDVHKVAAIVPTSTQKSKKYVVNKDYPATNFVEIADSTEPDLEGIDVLPSLAITDLAVWWPFSEPPSIVSSDLEGLDFDIWMNYPFATMAPEVIVVELHIADKRISLESWLGRFGYVLWGHTGPSLIFKKSFSLS